jgi:predicted transposase YbfD/YdcC
MPVAAAEVVRSPTGLATVSLFDHLMLVVDPRQRRSPSFPARSILGLAICAVLCGARGYAAIASFAAGRSRGELAALGFPDGKPPSESTIRRFLQRLDAGMLERLAGAWLTAQAQEREGRLAMAVDGKSLRGAAIGADAVPQLLSAVVHGSGITALQLAIVGGDEIGAARRLLARLETENAIFTFDALHTQRETARTVVEQAGGDYLMTVKGNQPNLRWEIENSGALAASPSARRGRQEPRPRRDENLRDDRYAAGGARLPVCAPGVPRRTRDPAARLGEGPIGDRLRHHEPRA